MASDTILIIDQIDVMIDFKLASFSLSNKKVKAKSLIATTKAKRLISMTATMEQFHRTILEDFFQISNFNQFEFPG